MRAQLQKRKLLLERILDSVETQHKIAAATGVRASLWASLFAFSAADDKNLQFPPVYSKRFTEHGRGGTIPPQKAGRLYISGCRMPNPEGALAGGDLGS